jgi:hypothetical protein
MYLNVKNKPLVALYLERTLEEVVDLFQAIPSNELKKSTLCHCMTL